MLWPGRLEQPESWPPTLLRKHLEIFSEIGGTKIRMALVSSVTRNFTHEIYAKN
jgi:hypothetical protein